MMPDDRQPLPMHIGTPLSPSATKVMLLGSGELGKELVIALQRLGVEVVAVDRYANAPGHQVAHRAHVIAMTDGPALRRLIEQEHENPRIPAASVQPRNRWDEQPRHQDTKEGA